MSKRYIKMRTAVFGVLLCAFLSSCGGEEPLVMISDGEAVEEPGKTEGSGEPGDEPFGNPGEKTGGGTQAPEAGVVLEKSEEPVKDQMVCVYVCGAVKNPGVVELPAGSRAEDALLAAGGFEEAAEEAYVNLASFVEDGQMLYFPSGEEAKKLLAAEEAKEKGFVNINTAGEEELCTLPGIGAARARDIIAHREKNGFFSRPEDIMKISGIKESAYEKIRDKITVE